MAETAQAVMKLLLLYFISSGLNGEDNLIFLKRTTDSFPCDKANVCYDIWKFNPNRKSDYIAIVHNAEIQISNPEDASSKCFLHPTVDDGPLRCQKNPASSDLILAPGETLSLQCVLLPHLRHKHCDMQQPRISLTWVDETGSQILSDSQLQIKQRSACDVTLTVALQVPASRRFRCQVAVDTQVQNSEEVRIRVLGPTGRGRGLILKPKAEHEGHSMGMIGATVGAVGCMVLTALIAAFVINKRRRSSQMANNSCNVSSVNADSDDVIYADIIFPAGSDRVWLQECESTEYTCVKYK